MILWVSEFVFSSVDRFSLNLSSFKDCNVDRGVSDMIFGDIYILILIR